MTMAQISKFFLLMIRNFLTLSTSLFEAILIKFFAVPKSGVNTFMPDACQVIPAIKSDRAGQPAVELRGDGL